MKIQTTLLSAFRFVPGIFTLPLIAWHLDIASFGTYLALVAIAELGFLVTNYSLFHYRAGQVVKIIHNGMNLNYLFTLAFWMKFILSILYFIISLFLSWSVIKHAYPESINMLIFSSILFAIASIASLKWSLKSINFYTIDLHSETLTKILLLFCTLLLIFFNHLDIGSLLLATASVHAFVQLVIFIFTLKIKSLSILKPKFRVIFSALANDFPFFLGDFLPNAVNISIPILISHNGVTPYVGYLLVCLRMEQVIKSISIASLYLNFNLIILRIFDSSQKNMDLIKNFIKNEGFFYCMNALISIIASMCLIYWAYIYNSIPLLFALPLTLSILSLSSLELFNIYIGKCVLYSVGKYRPANLIFSTISSCTLFLLAFASPSIWSIVFILYLNHSLICISLLYILTRYFLNRPFLLPSNHVFPSDS